MDPCDTKQLPAFYLVGDSISIDYHWALQRACEGQYSYTRKGGIELALEDLDHPQGANGGSSSAVLEHLREALQDPSALPGTVLINCGLHDIKVDPANGTNQVPLDTYRRNLESIVELVSGAGKRLIWITTTPFDEKRHNTLSKAFHRYERDLATYNAAAAEIMAVKDVAMIDLHAHTNAMAGPLFRDHVHFLPVVSQRHADFLRSSLDLLEW